MNVRGIRRPTTRGKSPHEIVLEQPPRLTSALIRNLADSVGGHVVYAVGGERTTVVVESWPPGVTEVTNATAVTCVRGGGSLYVLAPSRWDDEARDRHRDTANWLGVATRLAWLDGAHEVARLRARRLGTELTSARTRLAAVRELERQRLTSAITTTTVRDLGEVRRMLRAASDRGGELSEARNALDDLIEAFRVVVRGVFPAMLPDAGPRAALEELAATLPRPVRFTGGLGPRTGWQLESGFYHAVAAVLRLLANVSATDPVRVVFSRDYALQANLTAPTTAQVTGLRAALSQDMERIAVLGGELSCTVDDASAQVMVRLPERIEPSASVTADLAALEHSETYRNVRELVRWGQKAAHGTPALTRWDTVAERLTMAPRIAVVGSNPDTEEVPGVTILLVNARPDLGLAQEFLADGPRGSIDGVLCAVPPDPEFSAALRNAKNRVVLADARASTVASMAAELTGRGAVIAARRAVVAMSELVGALPSRHPLRWAVERVLVETHDFAELDLVDAIKRGDLLTGVAGAAALLLGAAGLDPRSRLGLPHQASDATVAETAKVVAGRWRAHAAHPAVGGRDRAACEVLIRTAEGLGT